MYPNYTKETLGRKKENKKKKRALKSQPEQMRKRAIESEREGKFGKSKMKKGVKAFIRTRVGTSLGSIG